MSNIEISGRVQKKYKELAENVAKQVIVLMGQPNVLEIAIEFVSEKEIKRLNREIRGIDKVTDVLSFPATNLLVGEVLDEFSEESLFLKTEDGNIHFGDMAICFAQTERQAKEYGVSTESEIKKLSTLSVSRRFSKSAKRISSHWGWSNASVLRLLISFRASAKVILWKIFAFAISSSVFALRKLRERLEIPSIP